MTPSSLESQHEPSYQNSDEIIAAFDTDKVDFGQAIAEINKIIDLDGYKDSDVRAHIKTLAYRALRDAALKKSVRKK